MKDQSYEFKVNMDKSD